MLRIELAMVFTRVFTIQEANSALPLVRRIVSDILQTAGRLRALDENDDDFAAVAAEMEEQQQELREIGCFYKDWSYSVGLVDFPCEMDGEIVFLCWRSDEEKLTWYHRIDDGYQGRRPLETLE